jgi:hypothetical protein
MLFRGKGQDDEHEVTCFREIGYDFATLKI